MNQTRHDRCNVALEAALLHAELMTNISGLVARAERRIIEGTYGRCLNCSGSIEAQRLRALPWAELCVTCQDGADERRQRNQLERRLREYSS